MGVQSEIGRGVVCGMGVCASRPAQMLVGVIPAWVVGDGVLIWGLAVNSGGLVFSPVRRVEQETKITLNPIRAAKRRGKVNMGFLASIFISNQLNEQDRWRDINSITVLGPQGEKRNIP
jgi:hypothetical protein